MTTTTTTTVHPQASTVTSAPAGRPSPWDAWVVVGLSIVALTAMVASFTTLADLAGTAGWGQRARWLLPCCIDALAMAAARVWLSGKAPEPARRYARAVAMAAVTVSVVGNSVGHLVKANHLTTTGHTGAVMVILVGSIPAIALAAVAHLATLAGTPVPVKAGKHNRNRDRNRDWERRPRHTTPTTGTSAGTSAGISDAAGTGASPAPRPGTVSGSGSRDTTRDTTRDKTSTNTGRPGKSRPGTATATGNGTGNGTGSGTTRKQHSENEARARAYWDAEREQGRTPTGAELARVVGVNDSLGRRWIRNWTKHDASPGTATEAASAKAANDTSSHAITGASTTAADSDSATGTATGTATDSERAA